LGNFQAAFGPQPPERTVVFQEDQFADRAVLPIGKEVFDGDGLARGELDQEVVALPFELDDVGPVIWQLYDTGFVQNDRFSGFDGPFTPAISRRYQSSHCAPSCKLRIPDGTPPKA
jgi:hypothetical protein